MMTSRAILDVIAVIMGCRIALLRMHSHLGVSVGWAQSVPGSRTSAMGKFMATARVAPIGRFEPALETALLG